MDIGLFLPLSGFNANATFLRALGPAVEERGFESLWLPEHVVLFDQYQSSYPYSPDGKMPGGADTGVLEPLMALSYVAAVTDRVKLGTAICLIPQRNPVYTAKQVADLDLLSGGRAVLGVGIGWLREEFEALNVPFAHRGRRTDEYLQVIKSLWTEETSSFEGELYQLPACRMYPKPVQSPHPPVVVGGESRAAMRRAARHGQGWLSFNRLPEQCLPALGELDAELAEVGRSRQDPDFAVSVCPYFQPVSAGSIEEYHAAGVDRLVVLCLGFTPEDLLPTLDRLVKEVLEPARALQS
jgi:probable F420-dependent oxidoreductase